jgi:hypothetical protein
MRRLSIAVIALLFVCTSSSAQERPAATELTPESILRYESRLRQLSAAVKRDAYVVGQLAEATRALNDFQNAVALLRALDRVNAALRRATDSPASAAATLDAINNVKSHLTRAKESPGLADLQAEQKFIARQTYTVTLELFRELDTARRERQALAEFQARLQAIGGELDPGMTDALGSTLQMLRVAPGV